MGGRTVQFPPQKIKSFSPVTAKTGPVKLGAGTTPALKVNTEFKEQSEWNES